ncbi:hypothetical protein KQ939_12860 [Planococcus sp. CP5-4]|uniref:hypothetical protein n=1 Tax=unclassified Planococcus (in: firmicutes) TaxID=2662419 RepID=UPI001C22849B|nr:MULTISPECIES: hypothetical protein [unclassified Planococcus (in: firmicutes)]MBU9674122.1 hypothetical protein [Planococcus sp. CP5-4_YE]MBV0910059.1 hypothetical protein [Planococcus sp. CP5-4_UN]MBW6064593.1 hypothetical protein [Planococcus sp. CP5-4]
MIDFYDQKKIILVTFGIILLISAIFVPAAVFYPAKVVTITPEAEIVGTSFWSLVLGSAGIVLLAISLFLAALIERPLKSWLLSGAVAVIGLVSIAFSLGDYYYMTHDSFTYNPPLSFNSSSYTWEQFERVEERLHTQDGTSSIESVAYYFRDGGMVEFSSGRIFEMHNDLARRVEAAGGEFTRIQAQ